MKNFYFTFGTDPQFPFGPNEIVMVKAANRNMAMRMFDKKYPGQRGIVNCAFCYPEEEFDTFRDEFYKGVQPSDSIGIDTHEDLAALELLDRLDWLADALMEICKGVDSTEKDEAMAMQDAAAEIRRLRKKEG